MRARRIRRGLRARFQDRARPNRTSRVLPPAPAQVGHAGDRQAGHRGVGLAHSTTSGPSSCSRVAPVLGPRRSPGPRARRGLLGGGRGGTRHGLQHGGDQPPCLGDGLTRNGQTEPKHGPDEQKAPHRGGRSSRGGSRKPWPHMLRDACLQLGVALSLLRGAGVDPAGRLGVGSGGGQPGMPGGGRDASTRAGDARGGPWQSPPGGLWCSLVDFVVGGSRGRRVSPPPREQGKIEPRGSRCWGDWPAPAWRAATAWDAGLRWPNDVFVGERKLAGVLAGSRGGTRWSWDWA